MSKTARQAAIKEILDASVIASQDELKRALDRRGFRVTQATLSRDMRELGVSRVARDDGHRYVLPREPEAEALRPIAGAGVTAIACNESLVVLRTIPGAAHTVGEYVDRQQNPDIIGTVAGDNTLLVIPAAAAKTRTVVGWLHRILFGAG